MMRIVSKSLAMLLILFVIGCAGSEQEPVYVERPVNELYNEAMDLLEAKNYREAIRVFEEVDRQHPYSVWASRAQLMSGYGYYLSNRYDEAIISLDRFIELHPAHEDVAYAYYLKAICYYDQIVDVGRDQKITNQALLALEEIVRRFPDSDYGRDANLKLDLTRDHLAGKEMYVGRFYLRRGNILAAIGRFREVLATYQTTTHVPEALYRLVEAYMTLGIMDQAQASAAVLGHNFSGSDWYEKAYFLFISRGQSLEDAKLADDASWIGKIWDSWF